MTIDEIVYEIVRGWIRGTSSYIFEKRYKEREKTTQSQGKQKGGINK